MKVDLSQIKYDHNAEDLHYSVGLTVEMQEELNVKFKKALKAGKGDFSVIARILLETATPTEIAYFTAVFVIDTVRTFSERQQPITSISTTTYEA